MSPTRFEPKIAAREWPLTHALVRAASGISVSKMPDLILKYLKRSYCHSLCEVFVTKRSYCHRLCEVFVTKRSYCHRLCEVFVTK
jgi:hypothetical protein